MWPFAFATIFSVLVALGALYAPRYCVFGVLALVGGAVAMSDLALGVAGLAVLMFFEVVPGISGGSLAKPYGLVLVLSWLGSILRKERMPLLARERPVLAYLLVGLVIWSAASTTWAVDPGAAESREVQLALVVALVFVVYSAVKTEKDFLVILWAFLTGAWLVCIDSILTSHVEGGGRLTGGVLDPNYLAATLACSIVVASFLLLRTSAVGSAVLVVYIGVDFIALALTESRGGLIAAGAALLTACVVAGPVRAQVIALAVLLGAVGLVYFAVFAPASARARVTTISSTSSSGRADEWNIALRIASQHPLDGVGIGNFQSVENQYLGSGINLITATEDVNNTLVVHNTYLELLAELGVVGLALFLGIVIATLAAAASGIRALRASRVKNGIGLTGRGLVAGTVGLLAAYTFLSGEYQKELWLVLALLATLPNVARSELERQDEAPVPSGSPSIVPA
jgi:O-antigen ligase